MEKLIFGATDGIRERVGEGVMRPNKIQAMGAAISKFFNNKHIALACDTRESGVWIIAALKRGIEQQGGRYTDLGILPTPALAKLVSGSSDFEAGIMVTASHNPASDNGIKVFFDNGDKIGDNDELAIEADYFKLIESNLEPDVDLPEDLQIQLEPNVQAVDEYVELIKKELGIDDLAGFRVVLDAASGAGYAFSRAVLERFGVEVLSFDDKPNGKNINVDCGALYPEHMAKKAQQEKCVGVALDGDADRVILADEQGRVLDGDRMVALISSYLLAEEKLPENAVVMTEYSNLSLRLFLEKAGIEMRKVINGDRNVAQRCIAEGLVLGGEKSGHILCMPWLTSSDGTFVTLLTLCIMKKRGLQLAELYPDYELTPNRQWAVAVREKRPLEELEGWTEAVREIEDGFADKGRVFARYSGTENKLRILLEAEDAEAVDRAGERLAKIVKTQIGA